MKELLTNSRATSFKRCRKRHWWEYEQAIRPVADGKALRMGSAVHAGLDTLKLGNWLDVAYEMARKFYNPMPDGQDQWEWSIEETTVLCLVGGWFWRWGANPVGGLKVIASELQFQLPLRNPDTGMPTPNYDLAGKLDGIVLLEERFAVLEHKTVSEDLSESSDYWQRLQMDSQISLYVYAARQLHHNVHGVLFDVIRKPAIRPEAIPLTDPNGFKIVLDAAGQRVWTKDRKKPRETGSTADGYVLQTRPMSSQEWAEKLTADIAARPEWYYGRREIARLDGDIEEAMQELWDIQKTIASAKLNDRWYRTVSRDSCPFCPYFTLCSSKFSVSQPLPERFVRVANVHQELAE